MIGQCIDQGPLNRTKKKPHIYRSSGRERCLCSEFPGSIWKDYKEVEQNFSMYLPHSHGQNLKVFKTRLKVKQSIFCNAIS